MKDLRTVVLTPDEVAEAIKLYVTTVKGFRPAAVEFTTSVDTSGTHWPNDGSPVARFDGAKASE